MAEDVKNIAVEEKEATIAFGAKERKLITDPLHLNNPLTVQVLGICSAMAVTSQVYPSLIMAVAVVFVTAFSSLIISLLRNSVPSSIRMIVQLLVIAALVQVVSLVLGAFAYSAYESLAVFIGLIITNCIVMGRLEAFAMANRPWQSFLDGVGNGLGYGFILVAMAVIRELFGKGTIMGLEILNPIFGLFGATYTPNNLMVLPAASLFVIGLMIWVQRGLDDRLVDIS
ncbi:MAG: NADH:ubiquinone reductase (Na(+)-transporting) subunit D [Aureispira sp.]|nr:NADH:ubiquinone reductase (Na(+)-transporting) subunit D [Aureispira sp.]